MTDNASDLRKTKRLMGALLRMPPKPHSEMKLGRREAVAEIIGVRPPPGCQYQIAGKWPLRRRWDRLPGIYQEGPQASAHSAAQKTARKPHGNKGIPGRDV